MAFERDPKSAEAACRMALGGGLTPHPPPRSSPGSTEAKLSHRARRGDPRQLGPDHVRRVSSGAVEER